MKSIRMLVPVLLAVAAVGVTSATASATTVGIGKCAEHAGGKFTEGACLTQGGEGFFEFERATKNKVTGKAGNKKGEKTSTTLTVSEVGSVTCKAATSTGELASVSKGKMSIDFTGCESAGKSCNTSEAKEGEIAAGGLEMTLLEGGLLTLGLPAALKFTCGTMLVEVRGQVNCPVRSPAESAEVSEIEFSCGKEEGEQKLEANFSGKGFKPATQTGVGTVKFEEKLLVMG